MPYVMIPVPAEHEQEMMVEVLKMTLRKSMSDWAREPLETLLAGGPPESRRLIVELTRASAANLRLSREELGERLGISLDDVVAATDEINARCGTLSRPWLILAAPADRKSRDGDGPEVLIITQSAVAILQELLAADPAAT